MGLEAGSFPSDLVDTNPTGTDLKAQGDDHIRLIKRVLKTTFPNLNGAVTPTPAQLNILAGQNTVCFSGMIVMWSGVSVPAGWKLCNGVGTVSNGSPVPDLRNRFIVGAGQTYAVGDTGGAANHTHTVAVTVAGHALTISEMPSHTHTINAGNSGNFGSQADADGGSAGALTTNSAGGGQAHSHGASGVADASVHLPPYFALAYIIKD